MFILPLKKTLIAIENESLQKTVRKTIIWSIVCLVSTMITLLTLAMVDGAGSLVGFDCTITSFSLLVMMSPVKRKIDIETSIQSSEKVKVELEITFLTQPPKTKNNLRASEVILNKEINEYLNEVRSSSR